MPDAAPAHDMDGPLWGLSAYQLRELPSAFSEERESFHCNKRYMLTRLEQVLERGLPTRRIASN